MHRSGTSAVAGVLDLLGAQPPRETMPPAADNPHGYWEAPRIARLNNRLLTAAGTHWNDPAGIPEEWFLADGREADRAEAVRLVAEEFPGDDTFVLKDPRICRLLPFWRTVLEAAGVQPHAVIVFRDPTEVARSLAARAGVPEFRPAAIAAPERSALLWLRYTVDAERHSRGLPRRAIDYHDLLHDWRTTLAPLIGAGLVPAVSEPAASAIDAFLDPALRRQRVGVAGGVTNGGGRPTDAPASLLAALRADANLPAQGTAAAVCDALAPPLDRLVAAYAPLRAGSDPLSADDPWARVILRGLAERPTLAAGGSLRPRRVLFLSGAPTSVGHIYRVEHAAAALLASGWKASWLPADAPEGPDRAAGSDIVVVFRSPWTATLREVADRCRARDAAFIYDVDDLVFDPAAIAEGVIAAVDTMPEDDRRVFVASAAGHRTMLEQAAAAILSTRPLAEAAAAHCRATFVLPNALGPAMEEAAADAFGRVAKASAADGRPRLVFASGTPSHARDFRVAAEGIARLFARRPDPLLVMLGHIDASVYDCLRPFADRIETRPVVPLPQVFAEVARCDVNLAPLEPGNRFCEGKSAVRCLFAAAVGVPTVASPTQPLREAIVEGETGLLATTAADWARELERLVDDAALRARLGAAARIHALAESGWSAYRERAVVTFANVLARSR